MSLSAISNKMVLRAYNPDGIEIPEQRQVIWNSPIGEYMSDIEAIIVITPEDQRGFADKLVDPAACGLSVEEAVELINSGQVKGKINHEGVKVNQVEAQLVQFSKPVIRQDENGDELPGEFYRGYAWGSGVKDGKTIGLKSDVFAEQGILNFEEDTYRLGRAYFCNSTAGVRGRLRVKLVPVGTVIPGVGPVDDGWGYVRQSVTDLMTPQFAKIQAGKWQSSYSFLQRFEYTEALDTELRPHFEAGLEETAADNKDFVILLNDKGLDIGTKSRFAATDPDMVEHPYLASTLANTRARRMFRVATTSGMLMDGGVFAPTTSDNLVLPQGRFEDSEEYLITRYPIDGPGSVRAVKAEQTGEEAKRIGQMEVVQYTLANGFSNVFKGMLGIVDNDEAFGDYDMIVCVEDEKLNAAGKVEKVEKEYTFEDAVLSVTMWYNAGSCIGVPHDLAKDLNADYDGDQGAVVPGSQFPELLRQAKTFKALRNPKLPKTKTDLVVGQQRSKRALLSMANIVGLATNLVSTVLAVKDQDRVAEEIEFDNADDMHEFFMYAIKIGTDIFKTSADYRPVVARLGQINSKLGQMGITAPWVRWRDDAVAFRSEIPPVGNPDEDWSEWQEKNAVLPAESAEGRQDAILGTFLRWILPQMELPEETAVRPLAYFRDWAACPATDELYHLGKALLNRYAERVSQANFSNKQWQSFVNEWQAALRSVAEAKGVNLDELANTLWFLSHDGQRHSDIGKLASAVFVGLPDEAEKIAREKPGLQNRSTSTEVVVTGLKYQVPDLQPGYHTTVNVVSFVDTARNGQKVQRGALVAEGLPGQVQPKADHYPRNMIGLVALNDNLQPGEYKAEFNFVGGKHKGGTWTALLAAY